MAQKVQTNNHVNNPTAHEKGSHAPLDGNSPVSSQISLAGGGLMAPTLPSTASQDTDAMSVDYSTGSSIPPKSKSKPAAGGSKTSSKAVKPTAAGSKASPKAVKPTAADSKTSPKAVKPATNIKTKKSAK